VGRRLGEGTCGAAAESKGQQIGQSIKYFKLTKK